MKFERACIPVGGAWSSPFARWQGPLAEVSSLELAVDVTTRALQEREIDPTQVTQIVLGWTIPQPTIFYGAPTLAARLGMPGVTGPMLAQACATSAACIQTAAAAVELEGDGLQLVVTTDRTSNSPLLVYPSPSSMDGAPTTEHWLLDSFKRDPWAGEEMVATAENVAEEEGITRQELDEVTVLRYEQYQRSLVNERDFQRRYMVAASVPGRRGEATLLENDSGVFPTTAEGLAKLKPVRPNGTVTYGSQTHPADGTAGVVVTTERRARELGREPGVVRLLGYGTARVAKARMPKAPVPAARAALDDAGLGIVDVDLVTTHNPFAVNDVYFTRQLGFPLEKMNPYGCSLVWGHPQGPTGARAIAELIEALLLRGGGVGLFSGCAAGDSAAALVLRVDD
jgi:acetyl-CoA C-acetyltransferase